MGESDMHVRGGKCRKFFLLMLFLLGSIMKSSKGFAEYLFNGQVYRIVAELATDQNYLLSLKRLLLLFGMLLCTALFLFVGEYFVNCSCLKTTRQIQKGLIQKLHRIPPEQGKRGALSDWITIFGTDMDLLTAFFRDRIGSMLSCVISIAGGVWTVSRFSNVMALYCLLSGVVYYLLIVSINGKVKAIQTGFLHSLEKCCHALCEILRAAFVIRFYRDSSRYEKEYEEATENSIAIGKRAVCLTTVAMGLRSLGYILSYSGSFLMGIYLLTEGRISLANMLYVWPIGVGISYNIQNIGFQMVQSQINFAAMKKIKEAWNLREEKSGGQDVVGTQISFQDVSFSYGDKKVIENLSVTISPGEKVAIVGEIESGKTTLFRLLLRFLNPDSGTITVGNTAVAAADKDKLRGVFALMPQQSQLFEMTIRDNISIWETGVDEEKLDEAIKAAGLETWISSRKEGVDTFLSENGAAISGGEKQRICLARCIYKDAPVFLLDEMTSSVDAKTEQEMLNRILSLREKTVVCITHRMAVAKAVDRILVLEHGKLVEDGAFDELVERKGKFYAMLLALRKC